jgi:hypothetical protein
MAASHKERKMSEEGLTEAQQLVQVLLNDEQWSDGKEIERLADLYWAARQAHNTEAEKEIWERIMLEKPRRGDRTTSAGNRLLEVHWPSSDRYIFDTGLGKGWLQYDTDQDAWYYGQWVNKEHMMIFSYMEGDVQLVVCEDAEHFDAEIQVMNDFHGEGKICSVIGGAGILQYRQNRLKFYINPPKVIPSEKDEIDHRYIIRVDNDVDALRMAIGG